MSATIDELTQARELVDNILNELHVDAYIFEVEPKNEDWEIIIECAITDGWERVKLSASRKTLLGNIDDAAIHQSLIDNWRVRLAACKRKET